MSSQSNFNGTFNNAQASQSLSSELPNTSFTNFTSNKGNFGNKFYFKKSTLSRRGDVQDSKRARLFSARPWTTSQERTSFSKATEPKNEREVEKDDISMHSSSSSFNSKIKEYSDTSDIEFEQIPTTSAKIVFTKPLNLRKKDLKLNNIGPIRLKRFPSRNFRGKYPSETFKKKDESVKEKIREPGSSSHALDVKLNPEIDQELREEEIKIKELPSNLLLEVCIKFY